MSFNKILKSSLIVITSALLVTSCSDSNKEKYDLGMEYFNQGLYYDCIRELEGISEYKDSEYYINESGKSIQNYERNLFDNQTIQNDLQIGDIIKFGIYQKEKGPLDDFKEDLEWTVLDIVDNKALLITTYTIDCVKYNDTLEEVTWETCYLRNFLNTHFINIAFNEELKSKICDTNISQSQNEFNNATLGNTTIDKVFILSNEELEHYIPDMYDRCSTVTNYAINKGVYHSNLFSIYWTRSIGCYDTPNISECFCNFRGIIDNYGNRVDNNEYGIRPCIWIEI